MKEVLSFVVMAVCRWLSGSERPAATTYRWYRRGRRLRAMLSVARSSLLSLDAQYWVSVVRVKEVEEAGERLKQTSKSFDYQADMLSECGGLLVAHRMYRQSRGKFEEATAAFVASLTAAEAALGQLALARVEAQTATDALGWLNARVAEQAPHDVFRLLSPDILAAGFFLEHARVACGGFEAARIELTARLYGLKESQFKR